MQVSDDRSSLHNWGNFKYEAQWLAYSGPLINVSFIIFIFSQQRVKLCFIGNKSLKMHIYRQFSEMERDHLNMIVSCVKQKVSDFVSKETFESKVSEPLLLAPLKGLLAFTLVIQTCGQGKFSAKKNYLVKGFLRKQPMWGLDALRYRSRIPLLERDWWWTHG